MGSTIVPSDPPMLTTPIARPRFSTNQLEIVTVVTKPPKQTAPTGRSKPRMRKSCQSSWMVASSMNEAAMTIPPPTINQRAP